MKKIIILLSLVIAGSVLIPAGNGRRKGASGPPSLKNSRNSVSAASACDYGRIPLYFIPNRGQVDERALFYAKTPSYTLWIAKQGLVFDSVRRQEKAEERKRGGIKIRESEASLSQPEYERDVSRMIFLDANPNPEVIALEPTEHRVNYFVGTNPAAWRTNIQTSEAVLFKEIYSKIDLKVYGAERQLEYDWLVKPGGAVEDIRFAYRNARKTRIDKKSNLIAQTKFGELTHKKPVGYQEIDGEKIEVQVKFKRIEGDAYGFEAEAYDRRFPLTIDPLVLVYSTYLGGSDRDESYDLAVDSAGSAYVAGTTLSPDFPVKNAYDPTWNGAYDAFVTKLSPAGNTLAYSTFLGGSGNDWGFGIAVDSFGSAYITGWTESSDFPVFSAYDSTANGNRDVFVTKFTPEGNSLASSTFLGGSESDHVEDIAVDASGAVYITGWTYSADYPIQNAFDSSIGGGYLLFGYAVYDAFVTKIDPTGRSLVFSTFLGGTRSDEGYTIAIDGAGSVYVTGSTESSDFPVANAYDPTWNGKYVGLGNYSSDGFVTKFTQSGNALVYSTYFEGAAITAIAIDSAGAAIVGGSTAFSDFPELNGLNLKLEAGSNVFVTKFSPGGNTLDFSTRLGGMHDDWGGYIALDSAGGVYVTGRTASVDFPLRNAYSSTPNDIFVTKLGFIGLYPPANLGITRLENNFIFFKEYINRLTWTANLQNQATLAKYKIYRKVKGAVDVPYQWIADVSASGSSLRYDDRGLKKTAFYSYRISSIDNSGNESNFSEISN